MDFRGREEKEGGEEEGAEERPHRREAVDYSPLICYALRQISGDSYDK